MLYLNIKTFIRIIKLINDFSLRRTSSTGGGDVSSTWFLLALDEFIVIVSDLYIVYAPCDPVRNSKMQTLAMEIEIFTTPLIYSL